jgi:ribulose-phosphate 3-epimerase
VPPSAQIQVYPSLLAADPLQLGSAVSGVESVIDWLHIDVMDFHFVPNLAYSPATVQAMATHTSVPLDCHLMIEDPDRWATGYAEAGASSVTFHAEAAHAPVRLARAIRAAGARAGLALKPATSIESYADLLGEIDTVLIMSVEPGFGGQSFLDIVLPKVRRARELVRDGEHTVWIQMDGGIDEDTIARCADAGADVFVAGASVYGADDPADAVRRLRERADTVATSAWWHG